MSRGVLGLRGQSLGGPKSHREAMPWAAKLPIVATAGASSITASRSCTAIIFAWGGGGGGAAQATNSGAGGGAGAVFHRLRIARGQSISWSVGAGGLGSGFFSSRWCGGG
jgi:hypothetical protein